MQPLNSNKKAKNGDEAFGLQEEYINKPHGWIQWKGTDVCMDIHCACGELSHTDGEFCYYVRCPYCGRIYFCNGHIEFIEMIDCEHKLGYICDAER